MKKTLFTVSMLTLALLAACGKKEAASDAAASAPAAAPAAEAGAQPAVIFDAGGKFDKSFNQSAFEGAESWKKGTGKNYTEFTLQNEEQREQAMQKLAERGSQPIVVMGFTSATALEKVAPQFAKTQFYIVDMVVDKPNVKSVVFREHEGSFLVGALAAMKSTTGKVGFIGGMDIPLIRRFACGYEQGVKYVNPKATVFQNMTGTTPSAWNDPTKGGELARSQMDRGADVVYAAAGGTGVGVLQAVADAKKFSIGVDSNQNGMHPGSVLTSMVKRVDVAVKKAFNEGASGSIATGIESIGLKEGGIDWALDDNNRAAITPEMEKKAGEIKQGIIDGKIKVIDYMEKNACK